MHLFGKINIQWKESLNIWVAVSDLFRDTWSDIFWKFIERPGTLRSPCDHRHGRSASFCADALGPQALVLCACVLHVQVTCRGAQLCFPRLLLAQSGTFLSLSMNVKVRAAKLSDSEVLPPPSLTTRERESRQAVVPSIKSRWQHHRCFIFPYLSPPGWQFDPYLLAFVFKSAQVGKTRRAEKPGKELGSWLVASGPSSWGHSAFSAAAVHSGAGENSDTLCR